MIGAGQLMVGALFTNTLTALEQVAIHPLVSLTDALTSCEPGVNKAVYPTLALVGGPLGATMLV